MDLMLLFLVFQWSVKNSYSEKKDGTTDKDKLWVLRMPITSYISLSPVHSFRNPMRLHQRYAKNSSEIGEVDNIIVAAKSMSDTSTVTNNDLLPVFLIW